MRRKSRDNQFNQHMERSERPDLRNLSSEDLEDLLELVSKLSKEETRRKERYRERRRPLTGPDSFLRSSTTHLPQIFSEENDHPIKQREHASRWRRAGSGKERRKRVSVGNSCQRSKKFRERRRNNSLDGLVEFDGIPPVVVLRQEEETNQPDGLTSGIELSRPRTNPATTLNMSERGLVTLPNIDHQSHNQSQRVGVRLDEMQKRLSSRFVGQRRSAPRSHNHRLCILAFPKRSG